jgi:hypothetical protein
MVARRIDKRSLNPTVCPDGVGHFRFHPNDVGLRTRCEDGSVSFISRSRRYALPCIRIAPGILERRTGHDAVTGRSRGADAGCLYGLNTQHDPWRASSLAWRTGGDDDGLLGALQRVRFRAVTGRPSRQLPRLGCARS